jgi:translation initiation factor 2B subunit (eIF-2B alpha/beta/delta family)
MAEVKKQNRSVDEAKGRKEEAEEKVRQLMERIQKAKQRLVFTLYLLTKDSKIIFIEMIK